jgi:hypothetical protein
MLLAVEGQLLRDFWPNRKTFLVPLLVGSKGVMGYEVVIEGRRFGEVVPRKFGLVRGRWLREIVSREIRLEGRRGLGKVISCKFRLE